jgi:rod shape-determining protein MreC
MAPPSNRRPGFSRRAQYGLFLGYVLAVGGIVFAGLLLILAKLDPRGFDALRGAALDITSPISSGGRAVVRVFTGSGEATAHYFAAASQNAELKRQLKESRRRVIEARAIEFENRRLKQLLKLSDVVADEVATARITGSTFDSSRRLATLSAGASSGVRPGQPVRSAEGLIGRVLETGRLASRVLLVTDAASTVPVQLVRDGTPALASGRGDGTVELKTLEVGQNPFKTGDIVVTSGIGGIYPPRIPVAIVTRTSRDITIARPLADPGSIDFAVVQNIFQPAASAPLNASEAKQAQ